MGAITGIGVAAETGGEGDLDRFDRALTFVETTGADHAEFAPQNVMTVVGARAVEKRVREVEAICRRHPLRYTMHAPMSLNLMDEEYPGLQRGLADAVVEVAARIGATVVVIHSGRAPASCGPVQLQRLQESELRAYDDLASQAREHGVAIAVENVGVDYMDRAWNWEDAAELAGALVGVGNPNLGLALDIAHAAVSSVALGQELGEVIEACGPAVNHIHLNDCCPRPGYEFFGGSYTDRMTLGIDDVHYPLGWGSLDLDDAFRHLHLQRDVLLTLEIFDRFNAEIAESVERSRRLAGLAGARAG